MPPSPLQIARDHAIIGRCLADAIEQSGLTHLTSATPMATPTVLRDPSAAHSAAARAKDTAAAARARAVELRLLTETICDSASVHAERVRRLSGLHDDGSLT
ncbi:MAG TPA: hypothetical protein VHV28_13900 [Solirubrobacteraceae bacterium]|jgi:hypothetical protein|nr:hypothetical protein [Solirubrobacteraceae bacterium]